MNKTGIVILLLCFLAAAAVVLWERRKVRKTMEEIERMLDAAMTGSFSETNFDEAGSLLWKQSLRTIFPPQKHLLEM